MKSIFLITLFIFNCSIKNEPEKIDCISYLLFSEFYKKSIENFPSTTKSNEEQIKEVSDASQSAYLLCKIAERGEN